MLLTTPVLHLALCLPAAAQDAAPLVHLTFERTLDNAGSLSGAAHFEDYAPGEEAAFGLGPWGWCLDNSAAARHGGSTVNDPPAGSAVAVPDPALDALSSYTITCWFRQEPRATGNIARLFCKLGLLDIMPLRNGFSLGIGEGDTKAIRTLPSAAPMPAPGEWTFAAIAVDAQALKARVHVGTLRSAPTAGPEVEVPPAPPGKPGPLLIANAFTIRPFKGWVDNVRVYDAALSGEEVQAVYGDDTAAATQTPLLSTLLPDQTAPRRALFRPSDICFSSRWQNDESLPVMQAFHVTRDLWTYGNKKEYADKVAALGITYQGTLNGMWASGQGLPQPEHEGDTTGRAYDLDGMKYVPTWMRGWKQKVPSYIGCCNHPDFRALFFRGAEELLAAGAESIHVDDWAMNGIWCTVAGTCFCEHCMAGFREYLKQTLTPEQMAEAGIDDLAAFDYAAYVREHDGVQNADDYRKRYRELTLSPQFTDFEIASVRRFYQDFSAHIDQVAGSHVPISWNNQFGDPYTGNDFRVMWAADLCDFQVGEKFREDLPTHIVAARLAEAVGMWQVVSPMPRHLGSTYAGLATTYALGQLYLVPWDIYMGTEPNGPPLPRFFATTEDFGPYYGLIHAHPELFDDYAAPALVGVLVNLDEPRHSETMELCERLVKLGVPYRLLIASAKHARIALRAEEIAQLPAVIALSARDTFCAEDQAAIDAALATRCVRLLEPGPALDDRLREFAVVRVEGPTGLIAIPRVKPGPPFEAVIHVVNWDPTPDGSSTEEYGSVTVSLSQPSMWGAIASARLYEPGNPDGQDLPIEAHPDAIRVTIPRLRVWGILHLRTQ